MCQVIAGHGQGCKDLKNKAMGGWAAGLNIFGCVIIVLNTNTHPHTLTQRRYKGINMAWTVPEEFSAFYEVAISERTAFQRWLFRVKLALLYGI